MISRILIILALILSPAIVQPVIAQKLPDSSKEALNWLKKIATAPRQHNYAGTSVYYADGHMEISRIIHMVDQNGEREKIEVLDGSPRIILRNNDEIKCYFPESKKIVIERRWLRKFFPDLLPQPFTNLNDNYLVKKGKRERVAGHKCQVILLEPRDNLRYGHKFWVDIDTGLLLKAAVMHEAQIIEQFSFAQIEVNGAVSPELLGFKLSAAETEWHTIDLMTSVLEKDEREWRVERLPAGFKSILEMKRKLTGKSSLVDHIALSDGLATVSVFIEPILKKMPKPLPRLYSSHGATNIYVRTTADNKITTVGEVPLETVTKIGDSVFKHKAKATAQDLEH